MRVNTVFDRKLNMTFDNVTLVPRIVSKIKHRSQCDTSVDCFNSTLSLPIVSAPMMDVTEDDMARVLSDNGVLSIIHRFQSIEDQVRQFETSFDRSNVINDIIGCAIGVTGDYQERFKKLYNVGCVIYCLDTANGMNSNVQEAVEWIRNYTSLGQPVYIIAGNVASKEGYRYLANLGVDCVRVGIAGGSVCETRNATGVYVPTLQSVMECFLERKEMAFERSKTNITSTTQGSTKETYNMQFEEEFSKLPFIMADGGIRNPSDFVKCLAVGADLVMCGRVFAGYKESPGDIIKVDGKLYKLYRGSSSYGVQQEYTQEKPYHVEGNETLIPYHDKSVVTVLNNFKAGLQSAMSYMNSLNLEEFRQNVSIRVFE
jgi:IMP dehydrogenase